MSGCRICLQTDPELTSLFHLAENKYLPAVVYNISGVKIKRKSEPRAEICSICKHAILIAERIILRCQESEQYIQNRKLQKTENDDQTQQNFQNTQTFIEDPPNTVQINTENLNSASHSISTLKNDTANEKKKRRRRRTKKYNLKCDQCDFGCNTARALVKHRKNIHQIDDDNIFPCNMCEKRFPWKSALNRHLENYHKSLPEDKKFLCTECGNIYINPKHLIEHQKQRHGPRRFRCVEPNCKQTFTRAFTLRRHFLTTHQNVSTYHCNDCDESFKVYDHWKYHNKVVHNNQKRDFTTYKKIEKNG